MKCKQAKKEEKICFEKCIEKGGKKGNLFPVRNIKKMLCPEN